MVEFCDIGGPDEYRESLHRGDLAVDIPVKYAIMEKTEVIDMSKPTSAVKNAWCERNYKRYTLLLRYDSDQDLIDYVEQKKAEGTPLKEVFREGIKALMMEEKK